MGSDATRRLCVAVLTAHVFRRNDCLSALQNQRASRQETLSLRMVSGFSSDPQPQVSKTFVDFAGVIGWYLVLNKIPMVYIIEEIEFNSVSPFFTEKEISGSRND